MLLLFLGVARYCKPFILEVRKSDEWSGGFLDAMIFGPSTARAIQSSDASQAPR